MTGISKFNPEAFADDMQQRTRKEQHFEEFETKLPDPKSAAMTILQPNGFSIGSIVRKVGDLNPFGKNVGKDDIVWLLDNTAYRTSRLKSWEAEFVAAVFEKEPKVKVADMVASIAEQVGLADDAKERATIHDRLLPFLWDIRMARIVKVDQQSKELKMSPTSINGIATDNLKISKADKGQIIKMSAKTPNGVHGILDAKTTYAGPEGWGIISDIDDTIKVTMTSDPMGIIENTFVNPATPIPGMPELYAQIKSALPEDTPWFYLSASPYNLYPFLKDFRDKFFPHGTLILRDFSWKTITGLLTALTMGTEKYKVDRLKKVNSWLPKRKMIVIGDSTQSDPEAYGEM